MLYAIVALLVIVLDQWTKLWIVTNVSEFDTRGLIDGFVSLVNVKNEGMAFSLGADLNMTVVFIAAAGVVALLTIILLATNLVKGGLGRWSLVFISAGGLSNAIDRVLNDKGAVLDMIKLDFLANRGINFPYFNVADIFITVFCFLLILYVLFGGHRKAAVEEGDEEEEEAPEDDLEDDDEEDDQPRRRSRNERRNERRNEPEPEPEAEPEAEPQKEQPRKRNRQSYEEDYERYKARKAQEQPAAAPAAPPVDPEDPFAEWERANQRAAAEPAPAPAPAPVEEAPAPAPAPAPAEEAPRPRRAAPRPAPAPAPAPEEFSLDDILAEFK